MEEVLLNAQVGAFSGADGTENPIRAGKTREIIVGDAHGRFFEAVSRGKVFTACNQAGAAITNLATTATGFILTNPAASGKLLVLLEIALFQTSTAAASANAGITLAANINPVAAAIVHTTPLVVRNCLLGAGAAAVGLVDSAATLPAAPVSIRAIHQPSVSATATTGIPPFIKDEVAGAIVIPPGCAVSLSALGAISAVASMTWEEVDII